MCIYINEVQKCILYIDIYIYIYSFIIAFMNFTFLWLLQFYFKKSLRVLLFVYMYVYRYFYNLELVNIYKNISYLFIYCKTTKMYDVIHLKCTLLYKVILLIQHSNIHQPYGVRMKFKSCPGTYSFLDRWTVLTNHRGYYHSSGPTSKVIWITHQISPLEWMPSHCVLHCK